MICRPYEGEVGDAEVATIVMRERERLAVSLLWLDSAVAAGGDRALLLNELDHGVVDDLACVFRGLRLGKEVLVSGRDVGHVIGGHHRVGCIGPQRNLGRVGCTLSDRDLCGPTPFDREVDS